MAGSISLLVHEPFLEAFLRIALETEGYTVFGFFSEQALPQHLATDHPDLVLLDLQLRRSSPWELYDCVRRWAPAVPVVAVDDQGRNRALATARGVDGYISHPFSFDHLIEAVQHCLAEDTRRVS